MTLLILGVTISKVKFTVTLNVKMVSSHFLENYKSFPEMRVKGQEGGHMCHLTFLVYSLLFTLCANVFRGKKNVFGLIFGKKKTATLNSFLSDIYLYRFDMK